MKLDFNKFDLSTVNIMADFIMFLVLLNLNY